MSLKTVTCPGCAKQTQINTEKDFSFCAYCGSRILNEQRKKTENYRREVINSQTEKKDPSELKKKLEEVAFFVQLSYEKKEYSYEKNEPRYFLKAQDILVELSEKFPEEYIIWWELCKPIDFRIYTDDDAAGFENTGDMFSIHEKYFDKAMTIADVPSKKYIIEQHDKYIERKAASRQEYFQYKKEQEQREAEERKEAERKRQAEMLKKEEEKHQRLLQEKIQAAEEQRKAAEAEYERTQKVWLSLSSKDYSLIDNSYFIMNPSADYQIICAFKELSKIMYLLTFRISPDGNAITKEQNIVLTFNKRGYAVKYDGTMLKILGQNGRSDFFFIRKNESDILTVNGIPVYKDADYITFILKNAKKSLKPGSKVFY